MRETTALDPKWLVEFAPAFFRFSDPTKLSRRKRQERIELLYNRYMHIHPFCCRTKCKCVCVLFPDMRSLTHGVYPDRKYESRIFVGADNCIISYLCIYTLLNFEIHTHSSERVMLICTCSRMMKVPLKTREASIGVLCHRKDKPTRSLLNTPVLAYIQMHHPM